MPSDAPGPPHKGCQLCGDSRRRTYLCAQDFSKYLEGRREELSQLQNDYRSQLHHLAEACHGKAQAQAHALRLQQVAEEGARIKIAQARAAHALAQARARQKALLVESRRRARALHDAQKKLAASQAQLQRDAQLSTGVHAQSGLLQMDGLILELQRRIIQRLLDVFPLQILEPSATAPAGTVDKHPTLVFIATLPLPDPGDDPEVLLPTSPQFAALGLLCTLLDQLARTLRLPLLHRALVQGSTSLVWEPRGGREDLWPEEPPRTAALRLFPAPPGDAGAAPGPTSPAAAPAHPLRAALHLLERSAGCLTAAVGGPAPLGQPPVALLATLCLRLASGAQHRLAFSGAGPQGPGAHSLLAQSVLYGGGTVLVDPGGATAEGWEVMPMPVYGRLIPPPPSADDDVEHWMRAMYAEEGERRGGAGAGGATGGAAALLGPGAAAAAAAQYVRLRDALWGVWDAGVGPRFR
ncbi:ATG14 [Auxenochlorella protothecoides x Auxenochlorella symbiontica]